MKTFKEWKELHETMDVSVADYNSSGNIRDLDDVTHVLFRQVLAPVYEKISPEDQQKMKEMGPYDAMNVITTDGSYYENGSKVINFYIGGMPEDALNKILNGIHYYLKEMNIKYGPFKTEKSGMYKGNVIRIPVLELKQTENMPTPLNLSNSNAYLIFRDILGYHERDFYDIPVADLLFKIGQLPDYAPELHQRDPYTVKGKGPMMYSGGLDASGIKARLDQIKNIALWAQNNGYDKITVA